ncbi:MAG: glycosyltransferase family 2 protein [Akkermansia sp.]|nr:glycosyltransferase family 2 protein [Akkermansia sp.]
MSTPLVSVISPCYNVAPYIGRFLDSLLAQTYKKLEVILVNDGSTDDTGNIIKAYIPQLEAQGYKVTYIEQENGGQSSAINNALKLVSGKFLAWPDPDDWLTQDSIEKRVQFLHEHPDVGMVRCCVKSIAYETGESKGILGCETVKKPHPINDIFEKMIFSCTWFAPVGYMLRMDLFDKVVRNREIYVTQRGGQNWQMMLPMAHAYPVWQLPEVLGYYCVRADSHSHAPIDFNSILSYNQVCEDVLKNTLSKISCSESIIKRVQAKYALQRFILANKHSKLLSKCRYFYNAIKYEQTKRGKLKLCEILLFPPCIRRISRKIFNRFK